MATEPATFLSFAKSALRKAGWAPLSVLLAHLIASRGLNAYDHIAWFDIPMHFVGGASIAYFVIATLSMPNSKEFIGTPSRLAVFVMAISLTASAAMGWEFAEWFLDRYFGTDALGGVEDTLSDMLTGCLGGLLLAIWYALRRR